LEELPEIKKELAMVQQQLKAHEKKQKQFYGKLFSKIGEKENSLYTPEELEAARKPVLKKCNIW